MTEITVRLTGPQAEVLHECLSMVENDPTWIDMIGGQQRMNILCRAHDAIVEARHD